MSPALPPRRRPTSSVPRRSSALHLLELLWRPAVPAAVTGASNRQSRNGHRPRKFFVRPRPGSRTGQPGQALERCSARSAAAVRTAAQPAGASAPATAMASPDSASKTSSGAWYTSSAATGRAVCTAWPMTGSTPRCRVTPISARRSSRGRSSSHRRRSSWDSWPDCPSRPICPLASVTRCSVPGWACSASCTACSCAARLAGAALFPLMRNGPGRPPRSTCTCSAAACERLSLDPVQ